MTGLTVSTDPVEIEADALGACLHPGKALDAALSRRISGDTFSQERHALIFRAIQAEREAGVEAPDELAVTRRLDQWGKLEAVGGQQYIAMLAAGVSSSALTQPEGRIEQILDASRLRRAHGLADRLRRVKNLNGDCSAIHEELRELLSETANAAVSGVHAAALSGIDREEVGWLWPGRIPFGMLCLLMGDPGLGKSLLTVDIAAKVSRAGGDVLLLSAEDHAAVTIRPRAEAAEADLDRIHVVTMRREGMDEGLSLPDDAAELDRLIERHKAKLVVVDPLMAHLPATVNSWSDQSMRSALAPLHRSAEAHGCAVLVVVHLNKATGASPLYRAGGSIATPAAVRSALLLARDPDDPDGERGSQRVLAHIKCNVAEQAESLSCEIVGVDGTAKFEITGTSEIGAIDLLAGPTSEERTKRDDAADFLRDELADGAVPTTDLKSAARDAGIGWRTIEDAKAALGINAIRRGFGPGGGWQWELPIDRSSIDRKPHISDSAVYGDSALESQVKGSSADIDRIDRKAAESESASAENGNAS